MSQVEESENQNTVRQDYDPAVFTLAVQELKIPLVIQWLN